MMSASILLVLERQAQDQLPGGKYHQPSEAMKKQAASVPTTNTISERDFAILDILIRTKPAANVSTLESLIMWGNNGTAKRLLSQNKWEQEEIMKKARTSVPDLIARFKRRREEIRQRRVEALAKKQEELHQKKARQQALKVKTTNKLTDLTGRVWESETEAIAELDKLPNAEKKAAVVSQISFHKNVLKSKGPKTLCLYSRAVGKKRRNIPLDKLQAQLLNPVLGNVEAVQEQVTNSQVRPHHERKGLLKEERNKLRHKLVARNESCRRKNQAGCLHQRSGKTCWKKHKA
jgi:hypothetical protein